MSSSFACRRSRLAGVVRSNLARPDCRFSSRDVSEVLVMVPLLVTTLLPSVVDVVLEDPTLVSSRLRRCVRCLLSGMVTTSRTWVDSDENGLVKALDRHNEHNDPQESIQSNLSGEEFVLFFVTPKNELIDLGRAIHMVMA